MAIYRLRWNKFNVFFRKQTELSWIAFHYYCPQKATQCLTYSISHRDRAEYCRCAFLVIPPDSFSHQSLELGLYSSWNVAETQFRRIYCRKSNYPNLTIHRSLQSKKEVKVYNISRVFIRWITYFSIIKLLVWLIILTITRVRAYHLNMLAP